MRISPRFSILLLLLAVSATSILAQDPPPSEEVRQFDRGTARPDLQQALGLSKEQLQQIRLMNRDRKPRMDAAQARLREANSSLDAAVYADGLDEPAVQARLREFQNAQAEVARIRFESELALRKILTPEQLVRFRGLRARMANARDRMRQRRETPPGERPLQRIRQLPRRNRVN